MFSISYSDSLKDFIFLCLFLSPIFVSGQSMDTPVFNFDRKFDNHYIDSLITNTKGRLSELEHLPRTQKNDTIRLELLHYLSYVYRSGAYQTDSAFIIANQLKDLAIQKKNIRYQLKALLTIEYFLRVSKRDFVEAMRINYAILKLMDKTHEEEDRNLWRVNNNLGKLSYRMEKFPESIGYYQKAIDNISRDTKSAAAQLAEIYQSMGESYKMFNEYEKALNVYTRAIQIIKDSKSMSISLNFAYLYSDLGTIQKYMTRYNEALSSLKLSEQYWEKVNNKTGLSTVWSIIAEVHMLMGNYNDAIAYANKAIGASNNFTNTQIKSYAVLAGSHEALQHFDKALQYQKMYMAIDDSLRKSRNIRDMVQLQAQLEKEKLELKMQQEKEIQEQKYLTLQKQQEINRIKNENEKHSLLKTIQTNELKQQLAIQKLNAEANEKQIQQQGIIKQLKINELAQQLRAQLQSRNFLYAGILLISIFGLVLIRLNFQLKAKNKLLINKNAEIETALLKGQTIERKRVATELHDNVNSILASVKVSLETIEPQNNKETQTYRNLIKMVENATREVRHISHNMLPVELEKEGLAHALVSLVMRLNLGGKTLFELDLSGLKTELPSEIKFNLYVICLELCQNIQKHAEATKAQIDFEQSPTHLIMFVSDNGKGIEKEKVQEGLGMKNVSHRAKSIGADLHIQSQPNEGTIVYLKLPLHQLIHV